MSIQNNNDRVIDNIKDDKLSVGKYIDGLYKFICNCETPMTLAIQGKWGTGKSSIMKLLQQKLEDNNVQTLYFNTWQYSQLNEKIYENFIIYLINHIYSMKNGKASKVDKEKLWNLIKPIASNVVNMILSNNGLSDMINEETDEMVNILLQKKLTQIERIEEYKNDFSKLIKEVVGKDNNRFVFFIDDLDRLPPEQALELLEIIKLFLDVENCIFILAIDYDVVIQGVRRKYGSDFSKEKGKEFFDKIIQVPFNVPVYNYSIEKLLDNKITIGDEYYKEKAIEITRLCTDNNPRTIKRIINSYNLMSEILLIGSQDENNTPEYRFCLYIIQCIQATYQEFYEFIIKNLDEFIDYLSNKKDIDDGTETNDIYNKLNQYIEQIELSEGRKNKINNIYECVVVILTVDKKLITEFKNVMLHYLEQSNDMNNIIEVSQFELIDKVTGKRQQKQVNTVVEAFKSSVEFILSKKSKNKSINNFSSWLVPNKQFDEKTKGYFVSNKELVVDGQTYTLATHSGSRDKIRQLTELWGECAKDNVCIKWLDKDGNIVLNLRENNR